MPAEEEVCRDGELCFPRGVSLVVSQGSERVGRAGAVEGVLRMRMRMRRPTDGGCYGCSVG